MQTKALSPVYSLICFFLVIFFFLLNRQSLFSIIIFVLYYDYFLAKNLRSRHASRFVLVNFLAIVSQNHIESSTRWGFFLLRSSILSLFSTQQQYLPVTFNITEISTICILAAVDSFFLSEYLEYIVCILRVQCVGFVLMLLFICRF